MSVQYSNVSAVPLSLAVFLATDNYDYSADPNTLSATTLIKPVRQIILETRVPREDVTIDLAQMLPSRMGSAIHDSIETAWTQNHKQAMSALGLPKGVIDSIRINPDPSHEDMDEIIPVYLEQRAHKEVDGFTISGKFDFVGDGRLEDFKTTSVYSYILGSNDEAYILQGSIYRWLNPKIITQDVMAIQFLFTDWSSAQAKRDPTYPQQRYLSRTFNLLSLEQTERFIKDKIAQIKRYWDAPEEEIPHCSDKELWRSAPVFRYYKNPEKTGRSTKNFDTRQEALARLVKDGNVGIIREHSGQVRACRYCRAFSACTQKDDLIASGDLII